MAMFNDIFLDLRKSRNYTQDDVARLLDVSVSTIGMWETGKRTPTRAKYEAISDLFNVDIDYLYGKTNIKRRIMFDENGNEYTYKEPPSPSRPSFFLSDEEKEVIRKLREISDDDRASVLNSIDFFYNRTKKESGRKEKAS